MRTYTSGFYACSRQGSRRSAELVVPLILELTRAESVIDVGCGTGTWLSVFRSHGLNDILGVEGPHIETQDIEIPRAQLKLHDLREPLHVDRKFDLALSLEVAEHLPAGFAKNFVRSLVELSPVIMFSGAIPFQGGTNHVNEQWPEYWAAMFAEHDYVPIDCIRKQIWSDRDIEVWYVQNTLVFAHADYLEKNAVLKEAAAATVSSQLAVVHPRMYLAHSRLSYYRFKGMAVPVVRKAIADLQGLRGALRRR